MKPSPKGGGFFVLSNSDSLKTQGEILSGKGVWHLSCVMEIQTNILRCLRCQVLEELFFTDGCGYEICLYICVKHFFMILVLTLTERWGFLFLSWIGGNPDKFPTTRDGEVSECGLLIYVKGCVLWIYVYICIVKTFIMKNIFWILVVVLIWVLLMLFPMFYEYNREKVHPMVGYFCLIFLCLGLFFGLSKIKD